MEKTSRQILTYSLLALCCQVIVSPNTVYAQRNFPALDPPFIKSKEVKKTDKIKKQLQSQASRTEWTFHKTGDGSHPDGHEQQAVWLMNRARSNPTQEGQWLASSTDPDVAGGRDYFGVDKPKLQSEFSAIPMMPPAAFDNRLYAAAYAHSLDLIARDAQDHHQQFDRISAAGFHYTAARGSVFSYADSGINAHAAWNIDWGNEPDGMQTGRGHRKATMSVDGNYTNVGIAAIQETNPGTSVGEYVTTGNYCQADTSFTNHFNTFIVGTVWTDADGDNQYDPGEGKGSATVMPDQGTYYAITGDAGGFAIQVADGTYCVDITGDSLSATYIGNVTIKGKSVLLDIETGSATVGSCNEGGNGGGGDSVLPGILHLLLNKP